jgi:hypothetical protein
MEDEIDIARRAVGRVMWKYLCAKRLKDGMGGNPRWPYQGAGEPLGLSRMGRSISVSSMPLKGTGEAEANRQDARLG